MRVHVRTVLDFIMIFDSDKQVDWGNVDVLQTVQGEYDKADFVNV